MRHLDRAAAGETLTTYHLEAGIAACHAAASRYEDTEYFEAALECECSEPERRFIERRLRETLAPAALPALPDHHASSS